MNMDMINFYQGKNIQISEAVKRGLKQGLTEPQVLEGLERVFERVQDGETIKDISLAWTAWEEAKKAQGQEYLEWCLSRDEYMAQIASLKKDNSNLKALACVFVAFILAMFIAEGISYYV
jgi:hypothetical protein